MPQQQNFPEPLAIVTGASRGFGKAISAALVKSGTRVIGLARNPDDLAGVKTRLGDHFDAVPGDAADPVLTGRLLDRYRPNILILNAGASPLPRPLHHHTWESFAQPWEVDVRQAFNWTREALLAPLAPGSTVLSLSSRATLGGGSPLSGGYAGAKAAVRFLAAYAAQESDRAGLGIRFLTLLPDLTPETDLGAAAVAGYAKRQGIDIDQAVKQRGAPLAPEQVAAAVLKLVSGVGQNGEAFSVTASGFEQLQVLTAPVLVPSPGGG